MDPKAGFPSPPGPLRSNEIRAGAGLFFCGGEMVSGWLGELTAWVVVMSAFTDAMAAAALAGIGEMGIGADDSRAVLVNGSAVAAVVEPGGGTDVRDGGGAVPVADCRISISASDAAIFGVKVGSRVEVPGMPRPVMQVVAMRAAGAGAVMMLYCAGTGAGRGLDF